MFGFKLPISVKLGFVGLLALLTVGAIGLNEMWDRGDRAELAGLADNATTVRISTLQAAVATRRFVIVGRDIRLAATPADGTTSSSAPMVRGRRPEGVRCGGGRRAAGQDARGHRSRGDLTRQYLGGGRGRGGTRKEMLDLQDRLGEQGLGWSRTSALLGRTAAALPNAAEGDAARSSGWISSPPAHDPRSGPISCAGTKLAGAHHGRAHNAPSSQASADLDRRPEGRGRSPGS
jgi:hypothetical protein